MSKDQLRPGNSLVQREVEPIILAKLSEMLGVDLDDSSGLPGIQLDGFADCDEPVCVEVWAHQGRAKGGQLGKVMKDMCKLLLCERLLGKPCRKVFAVADESAILFLQNSWQGRFVREFGIECIVVNIPEDVRDRVRKAQKKQYR